MSYEGVMAGRTYSAMENSERRPLPWSATMPNLEYNVSGYSGHHSDITPESHHALTSAYDDLKKRYNDLQGKLTQTAKQLRDVQRRGSSPDLPSSTGSPRHLIEGHRGRGPPTLEEERHNGDLGDVTLLTRERDLLERQVSELEHRLTEAGNQLADSEHETRQLREHVSRQEDDLRQNQRFLARTEGENEELRKRLTLVKRQLRVAESDKSIQQIRAGEQDKPTYGAAVGAAGSQSSSLGGSLDAAPFPGPAGRAPAGSGADTAFSGELQAVLTSAAAAREEMKELRTIVQKQHDVILMLVNRQTAEQRESFNRRAEMQRQAEPVSCGIGARPKVRNNVLGASAVAGIPGGAASGGRAHLVHPVACTEDLQHDSRSLTDPTSRLAQGHVMRSPDRMAQRSLPRKHGTQERLSAPAVLNAPSGQPAKAGNITPETMHDPPEHELESHYDDLQFGGGVSVAWERGTGGETNTEDMEPLLPSPTGQLGKRNESMEHLHDDSEPYDLVEELESTTSGSTLCGTEEQEQEYEGEVEYQQITGPGSNTDLENHFRNTGSPLQQRSLNMDRNEYRSPGSMPRSYDNTTTNVNLNTSSRDNKFITGGTTIETKPEQPFLNNNPLSGAHKPINSRNLYPGTLPARRTSPEPTPPPRRAGRAPVEQGSGDDLTAPELRNCPVCNEDFPSHMAMDEFQQHVLECTGRTERICPMCDATFPDEVHQAEFERHVNEHFEDDATLQFEVMPTTT